MDDYISRENITERLERVIEHGVPNTMGTHSITAEATLEAIREIPAADVVEVRHAHWILHISDLYPADSTMECSSCNEEQLIGTSDSYCPNCGAKMDGGQDK